MGKVWLSSLADWLRDDQRLDVVEVDGWRARSRSSGGYEAVRGIIVHHDASGSSRPEPSIVDYLYRQAEARPVGALYLGRSGRVYVGAAGATNCAGKGGPVTGSRGTVPRDDGNRWTLSIEAGNNGIGEAWPRAQIDAYVRMVAVLCDKLGLDPWRDIWSHRGYCLPSCRGRKTDPFGPVVGVPTLGPRSWDDTAFRALVAAEVFRPALRQWGRWRSNRKPGCGEGDRGDHVAYLQGVLGLVPDGVYGPQTTAAVLGLQQFLAPDDASKHTGRIDDWGIIDLFADWFTAARSAA